MQQPFLALLPGECKALHGGRRQVETSGAVGGDGVHQLVGAGREDVDEDVEAVRFPGKLFGGSANARVRNILDLYVGEFR